MPPARKCRNASKRCAWRSTGCCAWPKLAETPAAAGQFYGQAAVKRQELQQVDQELAALQPPPPALVLETQSSGPTVRGEGGSAVSLKVEVGLTHMPAALSHLLDRERFALVRCQVTSKGYDSRPRVRVRCWVEGYSAEAVTTLDLGSNAVGKASLLPTFYPHALAAVHELTLATLHVHIEDLDKARVLRHESHPIWLLARNSAPIRVRLNDESGWVEQDMRDYLAAFVTPHDPELAPCLRIAALRHAQQMLAGYQSPVDAQARAIYDALKEELNLLYVNSFVDFNPDGNSTTQRVRLPRETLHDRQANCIDGSLLFASLLEAISLHPALVTLPGHAIVAWQTTEDADTWTCLDTTKLARCSFDDALAFGQAAYETAERRSGVSAAGHCGAAEAGDYPVG